MKARVANQLAMSSTLWHPKRFQIEWICRVNKSLGQNKPEKEFTWFSVINKHLVFNNPQRYSKNSAGIYQIFLVFSFSSYSVYEAHRSFSGPSLFFFFLILIFFFFSGLCPKTDGPCKQMLPTQSHMTRKQNKMQLKQTKSSADSQRDEKFIKHIILGKTRNYFLRWRG